MKRFFVLSCLAAAVCSLSVYAEGAGFGDKIKAKTESTSSTVQQKVDKANAAAEATGNTAVTEKAANISQKAKTKTQNAENKIVTKVDELSSVKNDVAASTAAVAATVNK